MEKEKCIYCGKTLKKGKQHCTCRGCDQTKRFMTKGISAPIYTQEEAIKHLRKKGPGLLRQIFSF